MELTDLEVTRLCAEAVGLKVMGQSAVSPESAWVCKWGRSGSLQYDPLHDDAQCMALLFRLSGEGEVIIQPGEFQFNCDDFGIARRHAIVRPADLRRAVCLCVANLQQGKEK